MIPSRDYRLPSETRLGRVRLQIGDLSRSVAYYQRVLGMRVVSEADGHAELGPERDDRVLVELRERPGLRAEMHQPRFGQARRSVAEAAGVHTVSRRGTLGLYHFAILLPDRSALGRFAQHVLGDASVIGMADHLVSEAIYLTDPDGLGIEVYADRPRTSWRVDSNGQIAMTTAALDVNDVVAAGDGQPWTSMPPGTVMGHVHLHVGDLERSEAFYHQALGFDKTVWTYPGALFLSAGGYHHHLGTNTWSSGKPATAEEARLLSWEVEVPHLADADAAARSVTAAGYTATRQSDAWSTADPWGTALRIAFRDA